MCSKKTAKWWTSKKFSLKLHMHNVRTCTILYMISWLACISDWLDSSAPGGVITCVHVCAYLKAGIV